MSNGLNDFGDASATKMTAPFPVVTVFITAGEHAINLLKDINAVLADKVEVYHLNVPNCPCADKAQKCWQGETG